MNKHQLQLEQLCKEYISETGTDLGNFMCWVEDVLDYDCDECQQTVRQVWEEYNLAYESLERHAGDPRKYKSYLQFSGHAQCALSLLARLGENVSKQHQDMARVMASVVGSSSVAKRSEGEQDDL